MKTVLIGVLAGLVLFITALFVLSIFELEITPLNLVQSICWVIIGFLFIYLSWDLAQNGL